MYRGLTIVQEVICYQLKKVNNKHTLNIMGFGSPTVQGRQGIALQEAYDLTGNNFYNPYWGYQTQSDGTEKENARNRDNHKPYITLGITGKFRKAKYSI